LKRKVGLFLLLVIVAVALASAGVVSFAMYRLVFERQTEEIRKVADSLSRRFSIFETMLRSEHERIAHHMSEVLPQIAADLDSEGRTPESLSRVELDALTDKYGVEDIYFIDRTHRIFQTNLATEMNLVFPTTTFTTFLDTVYGQGKVMNAGIDFATLTGVLNTYSYLGPFGKDYIIETSTEIRPSLAKGRFGWMADYFFKEMFADAVTASDYVHEVDLYFVNDDAAWSLLNPGQKLDPVIAANVAREGEVQTMGPHGHLLTLYSADRSNAATADATLVKRLVIRKVTYDISLAEEAVKNVLLTSLVVLLLAMPLIYWLSSALLQHQLLNPLFRLRGQARAIAEGDLELAIADTGRRDEIGNLASSFASMRDAVRQTIADLKATNRAIERFVPRAFLAIIGKPSIVTVRLGDNRELDMTVMFSDIRNFTGLSEQMTPDENFAFINAYLAHMGPVIRDHNGFIDKYIGDGIMALFENADDALEASMDMLGALAEFNAELTKKGKPPIAIGIGLNSGSLMLGTIGEEDRMDGTVISDAVNLASRIEGQTKTYGISLLLSHSTFDRLTNRRTLEIRPIDVTRVRGKSHPVAILEVYAHDDPDLRTRKAGTRDLLFAGVEHLAAHDPAAAHKAFEECLALFPGDPAAAALLRRCCEVNPGGLAPLAVHPQSPP
jgi:class 3 adenylate cyclase